VWPDHPNPGCFTESLTLTFCPVTSLSALSRWEVGPAHLSCSPLKPTYKLPQLSYTLYDTNTAWSNRFPVTNIFSQFLPLAHFKYLFNLKICRRCLFNKVPPVMSNPQVPFPTCCPTLKQGTFSTSMWCNSQVPFPTRYLFNIHVMSNPQVAFPTCCPALKQGTCSTSM